jgi:lipopolysaccharide/colanic/teichoic acid biosynthesis glycosyltransferase
MSLVGPRPCLPYEYELYQDWQLQRFDTLPGLTGLWQVSGKNRTTFEEMIRLDIKYVETKSWLLDVKIMFRTFGAVVGQIKDTQAGRNAAAPGPHTIPPFMVSEKEFAGNKEPVLGK